jgi:hypothetical protein
VNGMPIDLTMLFTIWMAGAILLVPLLGLTLRFGVPPFLEAVDRFRTRWGGFGAMHAEQRIVRLERELERTRRELERLAQDRADRW